MARSPNRLKELPAKDPQVRMACLGDIDSPGSVFVFQYPARCPKCEAQSLLCHCAIGIDFGQVVRTHIDSSCGCHFGIELRKLVMLDQLHPEVREQMKALDILSVTPFGEYDRIRAASVEA